MDGKLALETIQSFKVLLSPEDFDAFIKGADSEPLRAFDEVKTFLKGEPPAGKKADADDDEPGNGGEPLEEKPEIKKAQDAVNVAKEVLQKAEADLLKIEQPEAGTGDKPPAAITPEMFKGLQDELNAKLKSITDILVKAVGTPDNLEEIKKSVAEIKGIKETIDKIADMPLGGKAVRQGDPTFLEKALKGEQTDDDGKQVLSVGVHKQLVEKALENAMEHTSNEELRKSYEDSLLRYNAGGGTINQDVAHDLFNNHNIRLTK